MLRKRGRPSGAYAIAFVALLVALSGTAVALPGSNTVTSGDIKPGAVRSSDIRNSTVRSGDIRNGTIRGRDVRNNSLGGADINEGTLAAVPQALNASHADSADSAKFAGFAGSVRGLQVSNRVTTGDDTSATILSGGGFSLVLRCDTDGSSGFDTRIDIVNVSAGDDSHMDSDSSENNDFDEGQSQELEDAFGPDDSDITEYAAIGSKGSAIQGLAYVVDDPSYAAGEQCVATATLLGG